MNRPLIFGASLDALANETNPAIRQICAIAKRQNERTEFQRAIVRNLKNPAGMLHAIRNLKPSATAKNAARLKQVTR